MTALHVALRALVWASIVAAAVVFARGAPSFIYQGF
jgi:hypothetical protein